MLLLACTSTAFDCFSLVWGTAPVGVVLSIAFLFALREALYTERLIGMWELFVRVIVAIVLLARACGSLAASTQTAPCAVSISCNFSGESAVKTWALGSICRTSPLFGISPRSTKAASTDSWRRFPFRLIGGHQPFAAALNQFSASATDARR